MKLAIQGQDTLARAAIKCCEKYFQLVPPSQADILWACYDTPIGPDGFVDVDWVLENIRQLIYKTSKTTIILVSSQIPIGTISQLESEFPDRVFAYSPENIRVATAEADFQDQARIIVGRRSSEHDDLFRELFAPFTENLIFTNPETAEMVKHALNSFLGLSIAFINEIARLSKQCGADSRVVSQALLTEPRISPRAPLKPGPPFGGGHLARDISVLTQYAREHAISIPIISHIDESNR